MGVPRVVVLGGAGAMGRIIARDLARFGAGALEPVVADRDVGAARALGLPAAAVDVTDPRSLAHVLRGAAVAIASLPYRFNLDAMRGALAARAHYVDLGGLYHVTRRQLRLGRAFRESGRMALLGVGSAPGVINVLAARAAEGLERVREVHCIVGNVDRTRYRAEPAIAFGYSAETILDEFSLPAAVFREGKMRMVGALDPSERRTERFPRPLGTLALDVTLHSELATLPRHFARRGVREVTFRQSFPDDRFIATARALAALEPRPRVVELLRLLPQPAPIGAPRRYEVLRVRVVGARGGRPVEVTADVRAGPRSGSGTGPDIDTGAPPSIAAQLLLSGGIPARPGVHAPEDAIPPAPFLRELERRGMEVGVRARAGGRAP